MSDRKPPFNTAVAFDAQHSLHDPPLRTTRKLFSVDKFLDMFAALEPSYGNLPYFRDACAHFADHSPEDLKELQQQFLEKTNHDQFATMYPAFIGRAEMDMRAHEAGIAMRAGVHFARDVVAGRGAAPQFRKYLVENAPNDVAYLDSLLTTSLFNYARDASAEDAARYATRVAYYPLYAECGTDFMVGADGWRFAELQFSYQSYPHHLTGLHKAAQSLFPELMAGSTPATYPIRRLAALEEFIADIATRTNRRNVRRVVLDAWTATRHPMRNYTGLARDLRASYLLFDDFADGPNALRYTDHAAGDAPLFLFNQPLMYFLEPTPLFAPILHERLEVYDNTRLTGLVEDYLSGKVHPTNSPVTDLLNDKALYRLLLHLARFYLGQELTTPISMPHPLWSLSDPLQPDEPILAMLRANKDRYVICHRYLEAGGGVRIGRDMTQAEWDAFTLTYVRAKPYLFIYRAYYPMDPDTSLRIYACGNFRSSGDTIETSDGMLGRVNPGGSLLQKSYFFLCAVKDSAL